jgi:hypothetical protein
VVDIFFYERGSTAKLLTFAFLAAFAGVAIFGAKQGNERNAALWRHGASLAVFALTIWMWGANAKLDDDILEYSLFPIVKFVVLPVYLIYHLKAFARGWNYLFVRHPVEPTVLPALNTGAAINTQSVAQTLASGASDQGTMPTYHYENQAEKARELANQLERDATLAEAALKREHARAALADAERELELAKRRKST